MLRADVVESADQTALQQRMVALGEIGMNDQRPNEFSVVIDRMMAVEVVVQAAVARIPVRHDSSGLVDNWLRNGCQCLFFGVGGFFLATGAASR